MRPTTFLAFALATPFLLGSPPALRADATKQGEEYERARVERAAERLYRTQRTERVEWREELEKAFPGRVTDPGNGSQVAQLIWSGRAFSATLAA